MSKQNVKITAVITTGTQCQSKSLRNQNVPIIFFLNSGLQFWTKHGGLEQCTITILFLQNVVR